MTEQELQRMLLAESNSVEWKAGGDPEKIVKTLTAFTNDYEGAECGFVLCGVEELKHADGSSTARVVGISEGESRRLRDKIFQMSRGQVEPAIAPQFESVLLEGKQVLVVSITASSEVHSFKNAVVIRLGDKVTNATVQQHSELVQRKAHLAWLDHPCPGATLDDIDYFALEEISKGRKSADKDARDFLQPGVRMFGSAPPLTSRIAGPAGESVVPNRFAMLLIGKEPHHFMPGAYVGFARFPGTTRADSEFKWGEFFGPIPRLVQQVMGVLEPEASIIVDKIPLRCQMKSPCRKRIPTETR